MYSETDDRLMRRALELGARAWGRVTPNPHVGCVIARGEDVLGEGCTQPPGRNHAEVEAIQDARRRGHDVRGATAYVTLEPCSHFGRTPPCAMALIEAGIGCVVAAVEDPNPRVAGRGLAMLREAGVDVRCGLLGQDAADANAGFFSRMNRGRPWVRVKLAASLDGRTALENGESKWITGEAARADGHVWRARACAILTGIGTVRADDLLLTARGRDVARQPLKVVADSALAIDPGARLFDGNPVLIACARGDAAKQAALTRRNAETFICPGPDGRVDLGALLAELGRRGANEVHAEAGPALSGELVRGGWADDLVLYLAPMLIGPGQPMCRLPKLESLSLARSLRIRETAMIGGDLRILARVQ